jgi:hypothetical protein
MMANEDVASVFHISWVNKKPTAGQMDEGVAIAPSTFNFCCFFLFVPHSYCSLWLVKSMGRYVMAYINMQRLERDARVGPVCM